VAVGMNVSGAGIRPGTRIAAISGNTVTLTKPAFGFTSGNVILTATPYTAPPMTADFTGSILAEAGATDPVSLDLNAVLGGSSGLTGAKSWSLSTGQALPWWIGITSSGTLSVQPPSSELSSILPVRVQVTDASGVKKDGSVSIKVFKPSADTILPIVIGGSASLVQDLNALLPSSDLPFAGVWSFSSDAPAWMTLAGSGTLNAQWPEATQPGTYPVYATLSGSYASKDVRVTVAAVQFKTTLITDITKSTTVSADLNTFVPPTAALTGAPSWTMTMAKTGPTSPKFLLSSNGRQLSMKMLGEYFRGHDFTQLLMSREDSQINFNWEGGSPDPRIPTDDFSVRWTGFITPQYSESYQFYTENDDEVKVWLDGSVIINNGGWSSGISLVAGTAYPLTFE